MRRVVTGGLALAIGLALAACSAPDPIHLELPAAATTSDMHTLLVALEQDQARTLLVVNLDADRAQLGRMLPSIPEWDDTPAVYTVLAFRATIAELDILAGPVVPPAEGAPRVILPTAEQVFRAEISVDPPTQWVEDVVLQPALATLELARATMPVRCETQFVRSLTVGADTTDVLEILATSPDTALAVIREAGRDPALAELRESGSADVRTLPPEVSRIQSMATDGVHVWATDTNSRLLVLERDGTFIAMSDRGVMDGVVASPDLRIHGWRGATIHTMVAGSTRTRAWPELAGAPRSISELAVSPLDEVAALAEGSVWVQQRGTWRDEFTPDVDFGRLTGVAADAGAFYALTGASLFRRRSDESMWQPYTDIGTFERFEMAAFGEGRVAVVGHGGFIEVEANRPPFSGWCLITAGTLREIERLSIDPTRTTLYAIDSLDRDGSEPRALVLRVTLPR